jgi:hypothetical protein
MAKLKRFKRHSTEAPKKPRLDALGILLLLRKSLTLVTGLNDDHRGVLMDLAEMALHHLHPHPLPSWLPAYQVLCNRRRMLVDQFVIHQFELERSADEWSH